MNRRLVPALLAGLLSLVTSRARGEFVIQLHSSDDAYTSEAVLFPFDAYSLPYRHGVELTLVSGSKFSGDAAAPLHQSGLREPICFKSGETLPAFEQPVRFRINYGGARLEDAKMYAVYVVGGAA
jgi:hypothetical protein